MNFYQKYEKCCKEKGIAPFGRYASSELGCSSANIASFEKKGITPRGDIVAGAAKMLGISSDYLLGIIDSPIPIDNTLTEEECEILCSLRELNEDGLFAAKSMIAGIEAQDRYRKCNKEEEEISQEKHC